MPGMRTSVTMQWNGCHPPPALMNCSAVSKQFTLRCLRVKNSCNESRTAASSSTRATWIVSAILELLRYGKREMHEGAPRVLREPKPAAMRFHDRPAQRQSDAEALRLL